MVTGNITVVGADNNTKVASKNCTPFRKFRTELNATFIDELEHINIAMPMYNLIEYSDNYSDTSGSLWQFKRDEIEGDVDLTVDDNHIPNNLSSFKYKSSLITNRNGVKIAVPLKCLSNFWRSLEISLIICKVELSLTWDPNCVLCNLVGPLTFAITDAKLYVPIVTLSTEDNANISKLLSERFKRLVYWNKYKIIPNKAYDENDYIIKLTDASYQGVKRLFLLASRDHGGAVIADSHKRYFFLGVNIENYKIKTDERNIYDQPINDSIKQYDEARKVTTGLGDDYTSGCLLDFAYFKKKKKIQTIAAHLGKQKTLDADSRAIQQIAFNGKANAGVMTYYILEQ